MSQQSQRVFAGALALAFAASAAVQYNDPDPVRWIALYAAAALACGASAFRPLPRPVYLAIGAIAAAWAALLLPSVVRDAAFTGNEVERELGGLLLVCVAMFCLQRWARRGVDPVID